MPPDTAQRLSTLIRLGIIAEVDYAAERVRVKTGDNLTDWVRWRTERCGLVKVWNPPQLGEEVELIAPDGDMTLAYVGGSFANSDNPFPSHDGNLVVVTYSDGTRIEHNRSTGEQTISGL